MGASLGCIMTEGHDGKDLNIMLCKGPPTNTQYKRLFVGFCKLSFTCKGSHILHIHPSDCWSFLRGRDVYLIGPAQQPDAYSNGCTTRQWN